MVLHNEEVRYLQPFAWSPDGKQILTLVTRRDGTHQIVLIAVSDGSMRILKSLGWRYPIKMGFSPDGRTVAYDVPVRPDSADRDIFILSVDGRREIPLVQHPAIDYGPVWTPDGKAVLFASDRRGNTDLWAIQVAEGKPQGMPRLLKPDMGNVMPLGFSRDGSYYYGVRTGTEDVHVAELNPQTAELSRPPTRLTERFVGSNLAGAWSPDGRQVAYVSRRSPLLEAPGSMAVVIRSLETGVERDFFSALSLSGFRPVIRWFPDGQSLLLAASDNRGRQSLHRMNVQTGTITLVGTGLGTPGFMFQPPAISADGRTVYYFRVNVETRTQSIMAYDIDTGRENEVFRSTQGLLSLALSKNGERLAFLTSIPDNTLYLMQAGGGTPRELLRRERDDERVSPNGIEWTHDDRFILLVRSRQNEPAATRDQLWRIPSDGGEPQKVFSMEGLSFPSVDPDGRRLVFTAGQRALSDVWVMENVLPQLKATR